MTDLERLVRELPKVELHLHIEGTLEPELAFALAQRNRVKLRYPSVEALRRAYSFTNLQSFLDVYYAVASVLLTEQDFRDLAYAYLERVAPENVRHAEIFFDPQTHTDRGVPFETVLDGLERGCREAREAFGVTTKLILCFLRHLPPERSLRTLEQAIPHKRRIVGVGLDSSEVGHPPRDFAAVFERARREGFKVVAHAGEEGPPAYVWEALDVIHASRIDHGVRAIEDPALVERLRRDRIPLTVCPFSNVKLRVVERLEQHDLRKLLELGLVVTINSDDPAYFGGYVLDNYLGTAKALDLSGEQVVRIAENAIEASFLVEEEKRRLRDELARVAARHGVPTKGERERQ